MIEVGGRKIEFARCALQDAVSVGEILLGEDAGKPLVCIEEGCRPLSLR